MDGGRGQGHEVDSFAFDLSMRTCAQPKRFPSYARLKRGPECCSIVAESTDAWGQCRLGEVKSLYSFKWSVGHQAPAEHPGHAESWDRTGTELIGRHIFPKWPLRQRGAEFQDGCPLGISYGDRCQSSAAGGTGGARDSGADANRSLNRRKFF